VCNDTAGGCTSRTFHPVLRRFTEDRPERKRIPSVDLLGRLDPGSA
jgi:hypothetical protein